MASQIAAQMYTLRDFTQNAAGLATTFAKLRKIGYEAVQISGIGPIDPAEVGKMLTDSGITCASTHMAWTRFQKEIDKVLDEHRMWNCKHPAVGGAPHEYFTPEAVGRMAEAANEFGRKCAEAGMDWSYHNHNHELAQMTPRKTYLERFYELTDARHVKAELDTHWIQAGGGDSAQWITRYAGRVPVLHLKDFVMSPDGRERHFAEIGEGNMNFPAILQAAKAAGVQWYCIEQDLCYGRDPFDSLKMSMDNLNAMGLK